MTLVNSATGYAEGLVKRLDAQEAEFRKFREAQEERNRKQDRRNRIEDRLKLAHARWDDGVVVLLHQHGIPVEEPPPLFLPEVEGTG